MTAVAACGLGFAWADGTTLTPTLSAGYDFAEVIVSVDVEGLTGKMTVTLEKTGATAGTQTLDVTSDGKYSFSFTGSNVEAGKIYTATASLGGTNTTSDAFTLANPETGVCSATPSGTTETLTNLEWSTTPSITDSKYVLAGTDYTLTAQNSALSGRSVVKTITTATYDDYVSYSELPTFDTAPQTALALVENDTAEAWYAYIGTAGWTQLTGGDTGTGDYTITAEFDYSDDKVRFTVQKSGYSAVVLTQDSNQWLSLKTAGDKLASVGFSGSASLGGLRIDGINTCVVKDSSGTKYASIAAALEDKTDKQTLTLLTNAKYELSDSGVAFDVVPDGKDFKPTNNSSTLAFDRKSDGKWTAVEKGNLPANGYTTYENTQLGITDVTANTKPVIKSVQDSETGTIKFEVDGLGTCAEKVTYTIEESGSSDFSTVKECASKVSPTAQASIPLPSSGAQVKYYRVKFNL